MRTGSKLHHELQQEPATWIRRLAHFGYAAKGIVYVLIGILAFQAAFNWGGQTTGSEGALRAIASQPFGNLLLFLVAVGLVGYVVWRFVEAIRDPEHSDQGPQAIGRRLSYAVSGIIYAGLAFSAFKIAFGQSSSSGGDSGSVNDWTAQILSKPFGQWLVGTVGALIIAYSFYCFYEMVKANFRRHMKLREMSAREKLWANRVGRFGLAARGVVMGIVGYFFIQAALGSDASQAQTTEGALDILERQTFGAWLMGIVALGLISYGLHMLFQARYRRISP